MAGEKGRDYLVAITNDDSPETFTSVPGQKESTVTIIDEDVDVTDKLSSGNMEYAPGVFKRGIEVTFSGELEDSALIKKIRDNRRAGTLTNFQITTAGTSTSGQVYVAAFRITSYEETAAFDGTSQYSVTIASSGAITVTDVV